MEVILNVYINNIHAITAITVRESRRMTILSAALTQMNSLQKKKKKQAHRFLKATFSQNVTGFWLQGTELPTQSLQGWQHRGQQTQSLQGWEHRGWRQPRSPPSAGVQAPLSCRWSCARCHSAHRTGMRCVTPARCFYPYHGSAGRGRGDASEDLHNVHVGRERPPASPRCPVNRLFIKATGSITVIHPKQFLNYLSPTHVCMIPCT